MKEYTVKEVYDLTGKHEETVKRWIRSGRFPNSYRNSDKEGWRIPESDLINLNRVFPAEFLKDWNFTADEQGRIKCKGRTIYKAGYVTSIIKILSSNLKGK